MAQRLRPADASRIPYAMGLKERATTLRRASQSIVRLSRYTSIQTGSNFKRRQRKKKHRFFSQQNNRANMVSSCLLLITLLLTAAVVNGESNSDGISSLNRPLSTRELTGCQRVGMLTH